MIGGQRMAPDPLGTNEVENGAPLLTGCTKQGGTVCVVVV
jgi:hypothetical protein